VNLQRGRPSALSFALVLALYLDCGILRLRDVACTAGRVVGTARCTLLAPSLCSGGARIGETAALPLPQRLLYLRQRQHLNRQRALQLAGEEGGRDAEGDGAVCGQVLPRQPASRWEQQLRCSEAPVAPHHLMQVAAEDRSVEGSQRSVRPRFSCADSAACACTAAASAARGLTARIGRPLLRRQQRELQQLAVGGAGEGCSGEATACRCCCRHCDGCGPAHPGLRSHARCEEGRLCCAARPLHQGQQRTRSGAALCPLERTPCGRSRRHAFLVCRAGALALALGCQERGKAG
jgi:hypothetical protein